MRQWSPVPRHPNIYSYLTAGGTRYGVRRGFKDSEGMRDEYTKSGFRDWRSADANLKKFEDDLANGSLASLTGSKATLGKYFDGFAARKIKYGYWSAATARTNKSLFDNHIRPAFGTRKMIEIRRAEYRHFLDVLAADKGLSLLTIQQIHGVMMTIINSAVREDKLDKNRLGGVPTNGTDPKPVDVSPTDYDKWLDTAQKTLTRYQMALVMVLSLGMRKGELMGLRTTSITFEKRGDTEVAAIKLDLQRTQNHKNGGPLKNKASYRTIWVDGEIIEYLYYAINQATYLRSLNRIDPDGEIQKPWLWVNSEGTAYYTAWIDYVIKKVNEASGVKMRSHMFRHYFATSKTNANAPQLDLMHWLGHSSMQTTSDYTRPTETGMLGVYESNSHIQGKNGR